MVRAMILEPGKHAEVRYICPKKIAERVDGCPEFTVPHKGIRKRFEAGHEVKVTVTNNEHLIGNDITFNELLTILWTQPEAAAACEVEQEEKKREAEESRLREIFGEDYEFVEMQGNAGTENTLVKEKRRPGAVQLRNNVPRIARLQIGKDRLCEVFCNGYAIYDNGDRKTVLWVPDCGTYTYYFGQLRDNEKQYLKEKEVLDMDVLGPLP